MKKTIFFSLCAVAAGLFFVRTVYSNDLFISGEAESNGLSVVVSAPDGFTGRVEIYACSDLISNSWRIVTQNLRPTGDAPAKWYAETTNDSGFFIVGNMDMDNDGDGLPDAREKYVHKTNPNAADSDADEMPDGWELQHLLNPLSDADATTDLDGDELNNLEEYQEGTDPTSSDTDGDGLIDPYDLHACLFDYPVVGKAIFNMVATGYSRDYLPAIGFSSDGEQKLTLRWSDSFWYPADYRNEGRIIEAGSSQLHWTGEQFPEQINLYKDNFWYDLGSRNWDPPLTHPMCYFYIHPPGVPNYEFLDADFSGLDEYLAAHGEIVLPYPEAGNRFIEILSEHRDGSYTNYLCIMFSYNYSEPTPPICLITDFGNMRAVDYGVEAYTVGSGDAPRQLKTKFKFVFDQPVTNRIIKWITYYYDYVETAYVDYAVHQCEVTGKENGEDILIAEPSDHLRNMSMIVPAVDLNGDFDLDGDVDENDTMLRAPENTSLLIVPTGATNETPGSGAVPVTVGANVFANGMPESVLKIKLSGVESGEQFRLWSTTNIIPEEPVAVMVIGGGGGISELIEDPPLLIDTEEGLECAWPVKQQSQHAHSYSFTCRYAYAPEFPKTLYLECVSCGTTNDGLAEIELVYEYDGEEICSAALPITIIRSKLVPDWNHDRTIDMADQNQSTNNSPFRFWINDDADNGDISEGDSDVPGQGGLFDNANYKDDQVNGRSDLLDFFPVWLDIKSALERYPVTNGAVYKLRQADGALKFVYTDLANTNAGDYLIADIGACGSNFNQNAYEAAATQITPSGITLNTSFLNRIAANPDKGVLMMEAVAPSTAPLVLEIWQNGGKVWETGLALSLSGVEDMYRWINLRHVTGGGEDKPTNADTPSSNNPDSSYDNGKHVVFIHGYNVSEEAARGTSAEVFKRLYQSGSKARFTGVTWEGDVHVIFQSAAKAYYHADVINAFNVASNFATEVSQLDGEKYVMAHSLGNMVVSSAIKDYGLNPAKYFMFDAAVAMEAYRSSSTDIPEMIPRAWQGYTNNLRSSGWHTLFDESDGRRQLTWRGRFGDIPQAINYYSSGEDILKNSVEAYPEDPQLPDFSGERAWFYQEMIKGRWQMAWLPIVECHSGWGFNSSYTNSDGSSPLLPEYANQLTPDQLRTNSFFRAFYRGDLYDPVEGSNVAMDRQVQSKLLAEALPATSWATGANEINDRFSGNNIDLMGLKNNQQWPDRGYGNPTENARWRHGDFGSVAYYYNHLLYDDNCSPFKGGLK